MKPVKNRVLFNGDVNFLWHNDYRPAGEEGPYTVKVLDDYVDLLADNGVDTYVINLNGQSPWYPSRAVDHILTGYSRGNRDFVRTQYPPVGEDFTQKQLDALVDSATVSLDRYLDMQDAGVNWAAYYPQTCRRRGVTPWASIRMNDAHGANNWSEGYFNCPPQRDPKLRLKGLTINPKNTPERFLTVCDYEKKPVRDYFLAIIREVIEDFDYEGLELDWLRTPLCCNPPATRQAIEMMTAFHAEIREIARAKAKKTGKPYYLGIRLPIRLGVLLTNGIDIEELARQDLVDFIAPSNFWQTSWDVPYDRMRQRLGDDVAIYGVVEDAPNWMFTRSEDGSRQTYRLLSTTRPLVWGNAAGKLASGADGIEYFNYFCSDVPGRRPPGDRGADYTAIAGTGDLEAMRGREKHYALASSMLYYTPGYYEHAGQVPTAIETGSWKNFEIAMSAEPADSGLELIVQVVIEKTDVSPDFGASINGSWPTFEAEVTDKLLAPQSGMTHHVAEYMAMNFRLPLDRVHDGINEITIYDGSNDHSPDPKRKVTLTRVLGLEAAVLKAR